jgi:hypothetical protein
MEDIIAFRIIVPSLEIQRRVQSALSTKLGIDKIRSYVEYPPSSGYRASHLVLHQTLTHGGKYYSYPIEIQLRTFYQHLWATTSESFGEQTKEGGGTADEREYLNELAKKIREFEDNAPEYHQIAGLQAFGTTSFTVLVFDKVKGHRSLTESFDGRLDDAIRRLLYLEDLFRADFSNETVLIGVSSGEKELKITHMRYFWPMGIPEIPEVVRPIKPRPSP